VGPERAPRRGIERPHRSPSASAQPRLPRPAHHPSPCAFPRTLTPATPRSPHRAMRWHHVRAGPAGRTPHRPAVRPQSPLARATYRGGIFVADITSTQTAYLNGRLSPRACATPTTAPVRPAVSPWPPPKQAPVPALFRRRPTPHHIPYLTFEP
jgi:hypothetical protein